jgi:hypothetical protein
MNNSNLILMIGEIFKMVSNQIRISIETITLQNSVTHMSDKYSELLNSKNMRYHFLSS